MIVLKCYIVKNAAKVLLFFGIHNTKKWGFCIFYVFSRVYVLYY